MSSSKIVAATIMVSIAASAITPNQSTAQAFVHPSPFSSKYATRKLSLPSPTVTTQTMHPSELRSWNLFQMTATASSEDLKKEISSMRAKEIRSELESYGIPTKSFFDKSELVDACVRARLEEMVPIDTSAVNGDSASVESSDTSGSSSTSTTTANRKDRIQEEMDKCKKVKVGELKKELESGGVSTKSFFEKSEFVRAVAELRVDGPKKSANGSNSGRRVVEEEPRDPSYRDVIVTKFEGAEGFLGNVIDVKARR